ncbi:MAG: molybdopterin synthase sulfur carrier subunit [Thermoprotei archaeon]|nr:MAG: molybdopterin synthase sulfur carrier subunit [Thermoprotei archaeon]
MRVKIRLFAAFREAAGTKEIELELPENSKVIDVIRKLAEHFPKLRKMLLKGDEMRKDYHVVKGGRWLKENDLLIDGDQIAIFPPVGGG